MAFGCLNKLVLYQPSIKHITKIRLFKVLILPVLLYGSESWAPLSHQVQRLNTFVNLCLRNIFGLTLLDKTRNTDLRHRVGIDRVETMLQRRRLRWLDHVQRMDNSRLPKKISGSKIEDDKQLQKRQKQQLDANLKSLDMFSTWKTRVLARNEWRNN